MLSPSIFNILLLTYVIFWTELLTKVGLQHRWGHVPSQLSGGEQQRVTIARSIANEPEMLLLDEPTGDLDTANTEIVMNMLVELNMQNKITMIMVTHDVNLKYFANKVVHMRDGKIARIEYIEEERRKQAVAELGQSKAVQNMKSRQTNTESTESAPKAKIDMKSAQFTEVREPYDYDFLQIPKPDIPTIDAKVTDEEGLLEGTSSIRIR
mmetsp:Transcript_43407/g.112927  ORF Transcript_43407/g.112927 Transcript_43407/m.112927 type:complete len:210 (+) Transcript_43407:632-1261(+)